MNLMLGDILRNQIFNEFHVIFCIGAFIGVIFSVNIGKKAILISCIPLVISLAIMGYKKEEGVLVEKE